MTVHYTDSFKNDFQKLPKIIQELSEKKLDLFVENARHPSLHIKKMTGTQHIWEGRINYHYRFTFQFNADIVILRRIGTHDILKKDV